MSRTPAKFTQADVRRAIAANLAAGGNGIVELTSTGSIRIIPVDVFKEITPESQNENRANPGAYDEKRPVM